MKHQLSLSILLLLLLCGCTDDRPVEERYTEALAAGQSTEARSNDIFLGLKFGMSKSNFFSHCTNLNKKRLIREGAGGATVRYDMEGLKSAAHMIFSPEFTEDGKHLYAMNFRVKYDSWAPWAKEFSNLELLKDLTRYMEEKYGDGWMAVPHEKAGRVVTQIDNNRRIAMWLENKDVVRGRFVDLSIKPEEKLYFPEEFDPPTVLETTEAATKR